MDAYQELNILNATIGPLIKVLVGENIYHLW